MTYAIVRLRFRRVTYVTQMSARNHRDDQALCKFWTRVSGAQAKPLAMRRSQRFMCSRVDHDWQISGSQGGYAGATGVINDVAKNRATLLPLGPNSDGPARSSGRLFAFQVPGRWHRR